MFAFPPWAYVLLSVSGSGAKAKGRVCMEVTKDLSSVFPN